MGCVNAKTEAKPQPVPQAAPPKAEMKASAEEKKVATASTVSPKKKATVYIIYYSMYGHVATLAEAVAKGVESTGAVAKVFQVPETLEEAVLHKMGAPAKRPYPVIQAQDLEQADAIVLGIPTRYGMACAQMKAFWDSTGQLWQKGSLVGKVGSVFFSTGTQAGGQETTAFTWLPNFVHHGMLYVSTGYSDPKLFNMTEVHGGSPYGAGSIAGPDGSRQPSQLELDVAQSQGAHVAKFTNQLKAGSA